MGGDDVRLQRFEAQRPQLRAVAYRVLGSLAEAEDAVQETWLRLQRTDTSDVANLGGWLTTVVGRICLDVLRTRAGRREDPLEVHLPDPLVTLAPDPEQEAVHAEQVGLALLLLLDTLAPAERLAYVLHDLFDVPFDDIAPLVDRTPAATRQLASRARRRVRAAPVRPDADLPRQRGVVDAFLAAARDGDLARLVAVLYPDVVLVADLGPGVPGKRLRGAAAVAGSAASYQRVAAGNRPVLVNGLPGVASASAGEVLSVLAFTVVGGLVVEIDVLADPARLRSLGIAALLARGAA